MKLKINFYNLNTLRKHNQKQLKSQKVINKFTEIKKKLLNISQLILSDWVDVFLTSQEPILSAKAGKFEAFNFSDMDWDTKLSIFALQLLLGFCEPSFVLFFLLFASDNFCSIKLTKDGVFFNFKPRGPFTSIEFSSPPIYKIQNLTVNWHKYIRVQKC